MKGDWTRFILLLREPAWIDQDMIEYGACAEMSTFHVSAHREVVVTGSGGRFSRIHLALVRLANRLV